MRACTGEEGQLIQECICKTVMAAEDAVRVYGREVALPKTSFEAWIFFAATKQRTLPVKEVGDEAGTRLGGDLHIALRILYLDLRQPLSI